jgi:hypothetical protein
MINLIFNFRSNMKRTLRPIQPRSKTVLSQQHTFAIYVKNFTLIIPCIVNQFTKVPTRWHFVQYFIISCKSLYMFRA